MTADITREASLWADDPATSAVNNYLQMWDVDNLFVVGGSAFPQFAGHHPTATIGALAYRASEGIEKYLKNGGGQLVEGKGRVSKLKSGSRIIDLVLRTLFTSRYYVARFFNANKYENC